MMGATGYAGIELVRLLYGHPEVEIAHLCSVGSAGQAVEGLYASFLGSGLLLENLPAAQVAEESDIVFTSLPHGASAENVKALMDAGARVIDLSGDFRYRDVKVYEQWYRVAHPYPELLEGAVYGLSELYREKIAPARLVGNPGCYTTCAILALAPLLAGGIASGRGIVVDAKSGVTGAGKKPSTGLHYCEVDESMKAYGVATHRHTSEIEQELSAAAGQKVILSFTPHLVPLKRGILATCYADYLGGDVAACYQAAYGEEPFIKVLSQGQLPEIKHVAGSNQCHIGFQVDERTGKIIVVSVLDNLIKGAGGQAVQNMNLMFGLDESTGLGALPWYL